MEQAREIRIGSGPPGPRLRYDLAWIWQAAALWLGAALTIAIATSIPGW